MSITDGRETRVDPFAHEADEVERDTVETDTIQADDLVPLSDAQ